MKSRSEAHGRERVRDGEGSEQLTRTIVIGSGDPWEASSAGASITFLRFA